MVIGGGVTSLSNAASTHRWLLAVMALGISLIAMPMLFSPIPHHDSVRHLLSVGEATLSPETCRQDPQSALLIRLGRPVTAVIECGQFHLIDSLNDFRVLRVVTLLGLVGVALLISVLFGKRRVLGAIAGLLVAVLPGVMYNVQVGNLANVSAWAAALALALLLARQVLPSPRLAPHFIAVAAVFFVSSTYPAALLLLLVGLAPALGRAITHMQRIPWGSAWLAAVWLLGGVATSALLLRSGRADNPGTEIPWAAAGVLAISVLMVVASKSYPRIGSRRGLMLQGAGAVALVLSAGLFISRITQGQVSQSFAETYSPVSGIGGLLANIVSTSSWVEFFFSMWLGYLTVDLWIIGALVFVLALGWLLIAVRTQTRYWIAAASTLGVVLAPAVLSWAQAMATAAPLVLNRTVAPGQAATLVALMALLAGFLRSPGIQTRVAAYSVAVLALAATLIGSVGVLRQTFLTAQEYWTLRGSVDAWQLRGSPVEAQGIVVFRDQWDAPLYDQIGDEYGAPSLFSNRYPLGILPSFRVALADLFPDRIPVYCDDPRDCVLSPGEVGVATSDLPDAPAGWVLIRL